jgi:hypothetical protein
MNKVILDIVAAFAQAMQEKDILYKLESINLSEDKLASTVSFNLLGTGKSPFDKRLIDIYNSEMLLQFRPEDIKILATAATLLTNKVSNKSLKSFDLVDKANPTVTFYCHHTKQNYKYRLADIEQEPKILAELGVDGHSGYILGYQVNERKKA